MCFLRKIEMIQTRLLIGDGKKAKLGGPKLSNLYRFFKRPGTVPNLEGIDPKKITVILCDR
jgi:hypothetical protein